MKNYLFILGFILLTFGLTAQSKNHRLGIVVGGGSQKYKGDLGNAFTIKNRTWYGHVNANLGYYLNNSFDLGLFGTIGDYGFCQTQEEASKEISIEDRCTGCIGRRGKGNLNARLTSGGILLKYKFANGYLLKEDVKLKPYVYFGAAYNNLKDIMKMQCVNEGNYYSLNAGMGIRYYITERFNVGYNLAFGYFTSEKIDMKMHGSNDMYMQNSLSIGIDLF